MKFIFFITTILLIVGCSEPIKDYRLQLDMEYTEISLNMVRLDSTIKSKQSTADTLIKVLNTITNKNVSKILFQDIVDLSEEQKALNVELAQAQIDLWNKEKEIKQYDSQKERNEPVNYQSVK